VLPNVSDECDVTGLYPIELHDTYVYLQDKPKRLYDNAFVFSKSMGDRAPCLVPDPFLISNYGGKLQLKDPLSFDKKERKIAFCGGTTGNVDPKSNTRLRVCRWGITQKSFTNFGITNVVQMREEAVRCAYPEFDLMKTPFMTQDEQYKYKYLLSIDGNTACWDRLMWIANSQSLPFKYTSDQILWYYPIFLEDQHYIGVDMNSMQNKFMYYEQNPNHANWIIRNANHFVNNYANANAATMYMGRLMEAVSENKS
jgi:hypothetical protein